MYLLLLHTCSLFYKDVLTYNDCSGTKNLYHNITLGKQPGLPFSHFRVLFFGNERQQPFIFCSFILLNDTFEGRGGRGQGDYNLPLPEPHSPTSLTFYSLCLPTPALNLLCFSRYPGNQTDQKPWFSVRSCGVICQR